MSFTCELSGEPLQTIDGSIVVTPSGHVCQRRLILQTLESNGGKDPFEDDRPLTEDELIELKVPKVMPPRSNDSSVQVTLQHLQKNYDAILMELFDTRKLLANTREELSQALYQNDAAVRVIARMAAERDQARAFLNEGGTSTSKRAADDEGETEGAPTTKKAKIMNQLPSNLPSEDHKVVIDTWEKLHPTRKNMQKKAAKEAPIPSQISQAQSIAVALDGVKEGTDSILATNATNDGFLQVVSDQVYQITKGGEQNEVSSKLLCSLTRSTATAVASGESSTLVGFKDGTVDCIVDGAESKSLPTVDGQSIVSLSHHPDGIHMVAATLGGHVAFGNTKSWLAAFDGNTTYTCGALHPDGLLYLAGRADGSLDLWDLKSQTLAANLPNADGGSVHAVAISNNGYHVAVAYDNNEVLVWDLRKQSILATLNTGAEMLSMVRSLSFDEAGKYLAFSGVTKENKAIVCVVTVKQWNTTYSLACGSTNSVSSGLVWNKAGIAVAVSGNKTVTNAVFLF